MLVLAKHSVHACVHRVCRGGRKLGEERQANRVRKYTALLSLALLRLLAAYTLADLGILQPIPWQKLSQSGGGGW